MNTIFRIDNLKSQYVDIVYILHSPDVSDIKIAERSSEVEKTFRVSGGGQRLVSYETPSQRTLEFEILKAYNAELEIVSVVNRNNQHDFLNLYDSKYINKPNYIRNKQLTINSSTSSRPYIQWFVTWKCNYKCSYCWQEAAHEVYRHTENNKQTPENWANAFNSLDPIELYFTGGEPTLYKHLPELISKLNKNISLCMTTNFGPTFNLEKWKVGVPVDRFTNITVSLHPTQTDKEEFFYKAEQYVNHYGSDRFGIELVKHPDNLRIISELELSDFCNKHKIELILDDYVSVFREEDQSGMDKDFYQQIVEIKSIIPTDHRSLSRKVSVPEDCSLKLEPTDNKERLPVFCPAGNLRINVDAFADVYTCMSAINRSKMFGSHALPHYPPIGNLLDPDFKLLNEPVICWESFRCSACDSCRVGEHWNPVDEEFSYQLPICE